jgi:hypothetical protein
MSKSLWSWIFAPNEAWWKPVLLAALLSIFISIISFISLGLYSIIIAETPDFSISASPNIKSFSGAQDTIDIVIKDMHKNKFKRYKYYIDLFAVGPDSLKITFDPPQAELGGKLNTTVKLNYRIIKPLEQGIYPIKIVAIGHDNLERKCNFYLDKIK